MKQVFLLFSMLLFSPAISAQTMDDLFDEDDLQYYLDKNNGNVDAAIYEMLIIKSEDSTISVSGLSTQDTSTYFKRLASRYKQFNSGILEGG